MLNTSDIHPSSIILPSLISLRLKFLITFHKSQKLCKRANECHNMWVCDEDVLGINRKESFKTLFYFETSPRPLDPNLWTESQNTFPVRMKEQIKHNVDDVLASATSVSDFWLENERFSRKQQTYITLFQKLLTNRCAIKGHLIEHDLTTLKMSVKFSLWIISRGLWELFVLSAHWEHEGYDSQCYSLRESEIWNTESLPVVCMKC